MLFRSPEASQIHLHGKVGPRCTAELLSLIHICNDNEVKIDEEAKTFEINGHKFAEGDWISIDGSTGNIYGCLLYTSCV